MVKVCHDRYRWTKKQSCVERDAVRVVLAEDLVSDLGRRDNTSKSD